MQVCYLDDQNKSVYSVQSIISSCNYVRWPEYIIYKDIERTIFIDCKVKLPVNGVRTRLLWVQIEPARRHRRSIGTRCRWRCKTRLGVRSGSSGGRYARSRLVSGCILRLRSHPSLGCRHMRRRMCLLLHLQSENAKIIKTFFYMSVLHFSFLFILSLSYI